MSWVSDAVTETLNQPFATIAIEMVCLSLYFFTQTHQHGKATDIVVYLAVNTKLLDIVKRKHKSATHLPWSWPTL